MNSFKKFDSCLHLLLAKQLSKIGYDRQIFKTVICHNYGTAHAPTQPHTTPEHAAPEPEAEAPSSPPPPSSSLSSVIILWTRRRRRKGRRWRDNGVPHGGGGGMSGPHAAAVHGTDATARAATSWRRCCTTNTGQHILQQRPKREGEHPHFPLSPLRPTLRHILWQY